jgi:two-component system response regulator FixJ
MRNDPAVHVVDDDDGVRESLSLLLEMNGYKVHTYANGTDFLEQLEGMDPGCLLLDIHMPGISGLEVQQQMKDRQCPFSIVVMTGQGDIAMAVSAMKAGASDFIEKPYSNEQLLAAVNQAIEGLETSVEEQEKIKDAQSKVATLSRREYQVLQGLLAALPNKLIAYELDLSIRTVEVYRAKIMDKFGTRGLSAAVRIALIAGVEPLVTQKGSAR